MRYVVLAVAIVFVSALAVLTILDLVNNGVTLGGLVGLGVVIFLGVGVIGAALHPPRDPHGG